MRAYRWYETKISSASIPAAMTTVRTVDGSGMTRCADAPIAARSAAMLNVFAVATSTTHARSTHRGKRVRISVPSPHPVTRPRRAAISCTAAAIGRTTIVDQTRAKPNAAPTWE